MNKIYQRIDWENYPSSATPLNEDNLNKMDYAIDKLDDRVVAHETTKLDTATGNSLVKDVTFDETTGIFTIEKLSGSKITINTALEKISTNFHFNPTTQKLVLTLIDGTVQEIDLSALITQYEFSESDTITFEIDASGKVKANILNGSITGEKLEPNYLADVTLESSKAQQSALDAQDSADSAEESAIRAEEAAGRAESIVGLTIDSALSDTSVNPVQNKVITKALNKKADNNPYYMTSSTAGYGSGGYVAFARLEVKSSYQDSPIEFELICRGRKESCRVSIQFEGSSANDPAVNVLSYTGADYGVFARKINTSIWELYYTKSENYDLLTVTRISHVNGLAVEITHPGTYLSTKPTTTIVNASLGCAVASAETATKAIQDGKGNVITETYAKKSIYGDTTINVGRREGSTVGDCSTAEGYNNTAKGKYSHSEGVSTTAIGNASHSEGNSTTAIGDYAHSEGDNTIANGRSQHVQGKYNVEDTEDKYAHIVGGGTYEERKNIHTLDWNGNAEFAGSVKCSNVLKTLTECEASTTSTDIAGASALAELNDSLKTENSACTEFEEYNTAVNTTWTNNLYYKNQIIDCTLVIRLNALTANTAYNIFAIPSRYQPPAEIHKMYITHFGTKVLVTFRPTNTIIIKPLSDITTNTEILYIHETWIQI